MSKTIIILGANGRIGFNFVKNFLKNNYFVIAVDKENSKLKSIKSNNILRLKLDLSLEKNIKKFFKKISFFKFDITGIIYCLYPTSLGWGTKFEKIKMNEIKNNIFLQLGLPIILLKYFYKFFSSINNKVSIVMLSSIQGIRSPKFEHYKNLKMTSPIEYSAAKSGIIAITSYLAKYYKHKNNLRINCISPGGIKDNQSKIFLRRYKQSCIKKGMLDAQDIFGVAKFLVDETSEFIRGQNLVVDDGWSL